MQVILREDVEKLGERGEVVSVSPGYARNYLLPRKLALRATPGALNVIKEEHRLYELRQVKLRGQAESLKAKLEQFSCTIVKKAGPNDTLYGSVTTAEIAAALKKGGFEVDRRQLNLESPIKELGIYTVQMKLHRDVTADVKVWVVKD